MVNDSPTGGSPQNVDAQALLAFVSIIHEQAQRAFSGATDPGQLQLTRKHPSTDGLHVVGRYELGDVERMARDAQADAEAGFNVYIEGRTVPRTLDRRKRGGLADTRGVFALVVDSDADKGQSSRIAIDASLVVESSPGNEHLWLFLEQAMTAEQGRTLGEALRAATGADSDTGNPAQPYRVAGTINFPDAKKVARGRVVAPVRLLHSAPRLWSLDAFRAQFPAIERAPASVGPQGGSTGRASVRTAALLAKPLAQGDDRSGMFWQAVLYAHSDGLSPADFEALCLVHPHGAASKYIERGDLGAQIATTFAKAARPVEAKPAVAQIAPTYPDIARPVAQARAEIERAIRYHFADGEILRSWVAIGGDSTPAAPVHAIGVATGTGKTETAIRLIAEDVKTRRAEQDTRPVVYAVPRHKLGDEIADKFDRYGITARVFRGRAAPDPDRDDKAMCDDLEAVQAAIDLGASVSTSCCKGKKPDGTTVECPFFKTCSYQRQKAEAPDVWIIAHQLLFQKQEALGSVARVFIDESFWQAGVWTAKRGLSLEEIEAPIPFDEADDDTDLIADLESSRHRLAMAMRQQTTGGGVQRQQLVAQGITVEECKVARQMEWRLKKPSPMYPGMPPAERKAAIVAARATKHAQRFAHLWDAAQHLLDQENEQAISGRMIITNEETEHGRCRVVKTQGVRHVAQQWRVATLIMDATLPDPAILRAFYPQVQALSTIQATMPHATVRQVLGAPVSASKLTSERNFRALRRYVLQRWLETGRNATLIIAQKATAERLRASGLPPQIAVEHFNNIAGLDAYKDVRLLITLGRILPSPFEVERIAGALTGIEPQRASIKANGSSWYDKTTGGIRLPDGTGARVEVDRHPDTIAEAVRWQLCEAELIQAIGRARGVNRNRAAPVQIDILANVVLPITVNEACDWGQVEAGAELEMVTDGIALESPADMALCWPDTWATAESARDFRKARSGSKATGGIPLYDRISRVFPGSFRYKFSGNGQRWRVGYFDPATIPNPRAWLESRLGPVADIEVDCPPVVQIPSAPSKEAPFETEWPVGARVGAFSVRGDDAPSGDANARHASAGARAGPS